MTTQAKESELAAYILSWLRSRNGGELDEAIGAMRLADHENMREELEMILEHGGRPPNWVKP